MSKISKLTTVGLIWILFIPVPYGSASDVEVFYYEEFKIGDIIEWQDSLTQYQNNVTLGAYDSDKISMNIIGQLGGVEANLLTEYRNYVNVTEDEFERGSLYLYFDYDIFGGIDIPFIFPVKTINGGSNFDHLQENIPSNHWKITMTSQVTSIYFNDTTSANYKYFHFDRISGILLNYTSETHYEDGRVDLRGIVLLNSPHVSTITQTDIFTDSRSDNSVNVPKMNSNVSSEQSLLNFSNFKIVFVFVLSICKLIYPKILKMRG